MIEPLTLKLRGNKRGHLSIQCEHWLRFEITAKITDLKIKIKDLNDVKIEALGASPSQPSPLTEDLN